MEISLVDLVFQDFKTWGKTEIATRLPAINPINSLI